MANEITLEEQAIIRALQKDLPLMPEPYKFLAQELKITEEKLLTHIENLMAKKALKRISIALRHNNVGYKVNKMGVWLIAEDKIDEVGKMIVSHQAVTHCYRRNPHEEFPYNLYTMLHARSEEAFEAVVLELKKEIESITQTEVSYCMLTSLKELKKTGMKYFIEKPEEIIKA